MTDPLYATMKIAGSGLEAQAHRMRIISQNVGNANTTGATPGADPYQRKTISFASEVERASGVTTVKVSKLGTDDSPYTLVHDPGHIAADENGMVKMPNVNMLLEMADMRETIRSYEANMKAAKQARELISMTIDMMRG
ncbi:MAG: flagellar basal body rod protein FlgC [Rhizobiaceae bacterium]|jgi:flagellar basal-body rod protein FlgC|nr:flagellar basal body rod protein FlgC [Rhizobiaceae bacterium]